MPTNSLSKSIVRYSQGTQVPQTPRRRQALPAVLRASCSFGGTPGRSVPPSPLRHSFSSICFSPQSLFQSTPIEAATSAHQQYDSVPATDTEELIADLQVPNVRKVTVKSVRNRSINQFSGALRDMVTDAANDMESITLFQDPLPDPQQSQVILESVWTNAERKFAADVARKNKIDAYLRSISLRTRAHLTFHAKKKVAELYQFDQNCSPQYIRDQVRWLLLRDRFTCAEAQHNSNFISHRPELAQNLATMIEHSNI